MHIVVCIVISMLYGYVLIMDDCCVGHMLHAQWNVGEYWLISPAPCSIQKPSNHIIEADTLKRLVR